jgi:ubiquinone/menaquinone biosynthesis C-methylase UbiE
LSKDFFNARAAVWDENAAEKDPTRLEAIAAQIHIKPGAAVLDVGTGTGVFIPYLLKIIGHGGKLVCLDFAENMLAAARGKNFSGNITFLCADIENSNLPDASFHAAVCYSVFPHFNDKAKALKEIHRLLKKEGKVYICHTSSREHINKVHRNMPEVCNHLLPGKNEMRRLLTTAGFQDITVIDSADYYLARAMKL